jgi:glutamyl-tRNA reductase
MHDADVVIAATRASHTLIDRPLVAAALEHRPDRPMTLVDVSLPRNIDIGVRDVTGAQLIGIDDLGSYVAAAHAERRAVVPTVERIVDEELALVQARLTERTSVERPPAAAPRSSAVAA